MKIMLRLIIFMLVITKDIILGTSLEKKVKMTVRPANCKAKKHNKLNMLNRIVTSINNNQ